MKGWSGTLGERRDPSSALFITGTQVTSATVMDHVVLKYAERCVNHSPLLVMGSKASVR